MDNFSTLGECDFGAIWFVEGEGKVVVNAYQGAMYFDVDGFMNFARMVSDARKKLGGEREPAPAPAPKTTSKIRQFRPHQDND
jgi:hypothetical protein